jgi:DNA-binding LytR/AlgR family response regulator
MQLRMGSSMLNLLIVEDSPIEQKRCAGLVKRIMPNAKVLLAPRGRDALQILEHTQIDAAFIDKGLPDMDGFALAAEIRKIEQYYILPIIFVTGVDEDSLEVRDKYHHYAYITKPYTNERFTEVAGTFLKGISTIKESIIIDERNRERSRSVMIVSKGVDYPVVISDILYAESAKHYVILHTKKAIYPDIAMNLFEFVEFIDDKSFIRCHKSFAVNINNVYTFISVSRKAWDVCFDADGVDKCHLSNTYHKTLFEKLEQRTV